MFAQFCEPGLCPSSAQFRCSRGMSTSTMAFSRPGPGVRTATRSARKTASSTLWVTNSTVTRNSSQILTSSSCSTMRDCASTAANGSSMSMTSGSFASVRATATRCFIPPDNWCGYLVAASVRLIISRNRAPTRFRSARGTPRRRSPSVTLSRTVRHGSRAYSWNTTPRSAPGPRIAAPSSSKVPERGRKKPAIAAISVLLPQPLGPTTQRNSFSKTSRVSLSSARWPDCPSLFR